jgi:hypothetical protein
MAARTSAALFLAIIALMVLEALVLGLIWRFRRRGIRPLALAANLLAGISLAMATVLVVIGAAGQWLLGCLALALVMHLADLRMRWSS